MQEDPQAGLGAGLAQDPVTGRPLEEAQAAKREEKLEAEKHKAEEHKRILRELRSAEGQALLSLVQALFVKRVMELASKDGKAEAYVELIEALGHEKLAVEAINRHVAKMTERVRDASWHFGETGP